MNRLQNAVARAVNRLLSQANLALVWRDRHEALVERYELRQRQALGRDARPLHEAIYALDPASLGLLATKTQVLGERVAILGHGPDARLLADALRTTGRTATLHEPDPLGDLPDGADVVVAEPLLGLGIYDLVRRLRTEQE